AESNILRITQNGWVKIYQGKNPTTTRDVFRKANPNIIAKHSYWVLYLYSPEQIIIAFLGNDGLLRCSLFKDNKWVGNQCPIFLGFKILKIIASGYIDPEVKKIVKTNVMSKNLQIEEAWSSGYPISDSKLQEKLHCLGIS